MSWREYSQTRAIPRIWVSLQFGMSHYHSLTKVLHILIRDELHHNCQRAALNTPSKVALIHNDAISHSSRDEGQTVGDLCGGGVVVEEDTGESITEDREQQCHMARNC